MKYQIYVLYILIYKFDIFSIMVDDTFKYFTTSDTYIPFNNSFPTSIKCRDSKFSCVKLDF